jgi:hypothetical protein
MTETDEYLHGERAGSDFYSVWRLTLGDCDALARAVAKLLELDLADEPALRGFLRVIEKRLAR